MQKRVLSPRWWAAMVATALLAACGDQNPTNVTAPNAAPRGAAPLLAPAPEAKTVPDR